jgi:diaminopimelate decarboxylase
MNDLKRPAMYGAYHAIVTGREPAAAEPAEVDVVGPICETGDTFATARALPPLASGDLLAFGSAGAYGAVMASSYNSRLLVPEVMVAGERFAVVRKRPSFEDMIGMDSIPDWLDEPDVRVARGAA